MKPLLYSAGSPASPRKHSASHSALPRPSRPRLEVNGLFSTVTIHGCDQDGERPLPLSALADVALLDKELRVLFILLHVAHSPNHAVTKIMCMRVRLDLHHKDSNP